MSSMKFQRPSHTDVLIPPWFTERWELIGIIVIGLFEKLGKLILMVLRHLIKRNI